MTDATAVAEINPFPKVAPRWGAVFVKASDATRTVRQRSELERHTQRRTRSIHNEASAETTLDVLRAQKEHETNLPDGLDPGFFDRAGEDVLDEIDACLREDRDEGLLYGELCASEPAVDTCKRIASHIVTWLLFSAGLQWAAFGEDGGSVALVLRSPITDRRADFRISADGRTISVISINEHITAKSAPVSVDDSIALRETAAWVTSPA